MTSTIEIDKCDALRKHQRATGAGVTEMSELYDLDDDEYAPTESDLSYVIRRAERGRKPIEVFSG